MMHMKPERRKTLSSLDSLIELLGNRAKPEIPFISKVTGRPPDEVSATVERITDHTRIIVKHCEKINLTGRYYYAQFPAPIELFALVVLSRPNNGIESGVSSGVSSTFMLLGMEENKFGNLHSMDFPVSRTKARGGEPWGLPQGMASGWAVPDEIRSNWDLRLGKSEELLGPLLEEIGTLDFYCHDSPVDDRHFEFEMNTIKNYLRPGSLVVADNTNKRIFDNTAASLGTKAYYRRKSSLGAFMVA